MVEVGQRGLYLYKKNREEFTIEAQVVGLYGKQFDIEFRHPDNMYLCRRTLRTAKDRERFTTDLMQTVRREVVRIGAPAGNQNGVKQGPKRKLVTFSFSDDRLKKIMERLEREGKECNSGTMRELGNRAIDAYLK